VYNPVYNPVISENHHLSEQFIHQKWSVSAI
jgi:hypothetical protein